MYVPGGAGLQLNIAGNAPCPSSNETFSICDDWGEFELKKKKEMFQFFFNRFISKSKEKWQQCNNADVYQRLVRAHKWMLIAINDN